MLAEEFPDATEHIVVDDVDGWSHYYAWDFVPPIERGDLPIDPPTRME